MENDLLHSNLIDFAKLMKMDTTERSGLYDRLKEEAGAGYEWVRIIFLIEGHINKGWSFSEIYKEYGLEKLYKLGSLNAALGRAFTGRTGNDAPAFTKANVADRIKKYEDRNKIENSDTVVELIGKIMEFANKDPEEHANEENLNKIMGFAGSFHVNVKRAIRESKTIADLLEEFVANGRKQIILTGAPGTGKTYSVKQFVNKAVGGDKERSCFVQFHPSFDYSDFVEGLRPVALEGSEEISFVRMDGIFKAFCRKIVEANELCWESVPHDYFFVIDEVNRADLSKVFGELMFGLEDSYRGKENRFVTQYQNLETYRMREDGKAAPLEKDCFAEGFYIPKNLIVIGTMNDIDRSVEAFDFALRRRFFWKSIKVEDVTGQVLQDMIGDQVKEVELEKLVRRILKMNEYLVKEGKRFHLTEDYQIGPAYFKEYNGNNLQEIYQYRVEPILREYVRGRDGGEGFVLKCGDILLEEETESGLNPSGWNERDEADYENNHLDSRAGLYGVV